MKNIIKAFANFAKNKIVKFLRITQIINLRTSQEIIKPCNSSLIFQKFIEFCNSNSISQKFIKSCRDLFTVAHHNMVGNYKKQNVSCRDTSTYNPISQMTPIYIEIERGNNE